MTNFEGATGKSPAGLRHGIRQGLEGFLYLVVLAAGTAGVIIIWGYARAPDKALLGSEFFDHAEALSGSRRDILLGYLVLATLVGGWGWISFIDWVARTRWASRAACLVGGVALIALGLAIFHDMRGGPWGVVLFLAAIGSIFILGGGALIWRWGRLMWAS